MLEESPDDPGIPILPEAMLRYTLYLLEGNISNKYEPLIFLDFFWINHLINLGKEKGNIVKTSDGPFFACTTFLFFSFRVSLLLFLIVLYPYVSFYKF